MTGIISVYFGTTKGDSALSDGKNLTNFVFLYLLGHALRFQFHDLAKIKTKWLLLSFVVLNSMIIVVLLVFPRSTTIGSYVWLLCFPYCSPILIVNAVLAFGLFTRFSLKSRAINGIAASMFAVYLIHCQPLLQRLYQGVICTSLDYSSLFGVFVLSFLFSIFILCVSVGVDKLFTPLWKSTNRLVVNIQKRK